MKRFAVFALAPAVAVVSLAIAPAAHAYTPYHVVSYSSPAGNASANGVATPETDITSVSYGYNGKYLRFTMKTAKVTRTPPAGYQQMDFIWRFSYAGQQALVEYSHNSTAFLLNSDSVGTTDTGTDTTTLCTQCYATINVEHGDVEFFVTLENFNSFVSQGKPTAPILVEGTALKLIEADSYVDPEGLSSTFQTDAAPAPKGLTFTV